MSPTFGGLNYNSSVVSSQGCGRRVAVNFCLSSFVTHFYSFASVGVDVNSLPQETKPLTKRTAVFTLQNT